MSLALQARSWVKGPDLGVGACVVNPDRRGFSLGYSGLPRGLEDTEHRITMPNYKDYHIIHAELNAILNAPGPVKGWSMYVTTFPCAHCCGAIIQAGILKVISPGPSHETRWFRHQLKGREALREAGIKIVTYSEDLPCN